MKKTIFFLLLPLFYVSVNAQTYLEGSASVGMLLEHHGNMAILAKEPPYAFSLGVMKQSSGKQSWAPFYNYPRYGLRAMYLSPGDPEDIGQIYALLPSVRFSFLRNRWVNPGLQVGVGAGYVTKPYDPNTNYKNVVLSSHLNVALALDFDIETRITRNIYLRPSVGILHLSNGATLVPNYGLNLLMASLTAGYIFGEEKEEG